MRSSKTAISEMKGVLQNTILRAVNTIAGCYGAENDMGNFREIAELCNLEIDIEYLEGEMKTFAARRTWAISKRRNV